MDLNKLSPESQKILAAFFSTPLFSGSFLRLTQKKSTSFLAESSEWTQEINQNCDEQLETINWNCGQFGTMN